MKKISENPTLVCAGFAMSGLSLLLQLHLGGLLIAFLLGLTIGGVGVYTSLRSKRL